MDICSFRNIDEFTLSLIDNTIQDYLEGSLVSFDLYQPRFSDEYVLITKDEPFEAKKAATMSCKDRAIYNYDLFVQSQKAYILIYALSNVINDYIAKQKELIINTDESYTFKYDSIVIREETISAYIGAYNEDDKQNKIELALPALALDYKFREEYRDAYILMTKELRITPAYVIVNY